MPIDPTIGANLGTLQGAIQAIADVDRRNSPAAGTIPTNAITNNMLSPDSVRTAQIQAGSIVAGHITAGAIEAGALAADSVNTINLVALAVTTAKLDALAVTTEKIDTQAVTAAKIDAAAIDATHISTGTLEALWAVAGELEGGVITGAIFQSALTGVNPRIQIDSSGIYATDGAGDPSLSYSTTTGDVVISGQFFASSDSLVPAAAVDATTLDEIATALGTITSGFFGSGTVSTNPSPGYTGSRVVLNSSGIYAYNASNVERLSFNTTTGVLTITNGNIVSSTFETSLTNPKVRFDATDAFFATDSGGNKVVNVTTNGLVILAGTSTTPPTERRIKWTQAGVVNSEIYSYYAGTVGQTSLRQNDSSGSNVKALATFGYDSTSGAGESTLTAINSVGGAMQLRVVSATPVTGASAYVAIVGGAAGNRFILRGDGTSDFLSGAGIIVAYGGTTLPTGGWLWCDGTSTHSRTTYADLFAAIGTRYNAGNGSTTFGVPDFRSKFLMGAATTAASVSSGGAATVTLTTSHLPASGLSFSGNTGTQSANHDHSAQNCVTSWTANFSDGSNRYGVTNFGNITTWANNQSHSHSYSGTTSNMGSGGAHENLPPYVTVNWIIKT